MQLDQRLVKNINRNIKIKSIMLNMSDDPAKTTAIVDYDMKIADGQPGVDEFANQPSNLRNAQSISRAVDMVIASGVNITRNQAIQFLQRLPKALVADILESP